MKEPSLKIIWFLNKMRFLRFKQIFKRVRKESKE